MKPPPHNTVAELNRPDTFGFNNFFGRIGYVAISSLLKFIVQLIIVILYSRNLSLTDYGIYQFIWMFINFFSIVGLFGLTTLMLSTPLQTLKAWIKINSKLLLITFISLNTIAVLFLFMYGTYFSALEKSLLAVLLLLQNVSLIAESVAVKNEQEKKSLYANVIYTLIYAFVHLYLLYNTFSVTVLLWFVVLATFIKCAMLISGSKLQNYESYHPETIGKEWLMLGLNDVLGVIVKWLDKWLVLLFLPAAQFAIYFNGTYEIPVFMIILSAVGSVSLVGFSKIKVDQNNQLKILFERSSLFMASIVLPAFWFFLFYAEDFILTVFSNKYSEAIPIFKVSILILPVRIIYSTTVLQVYKRTDLILKGSLLDIIVAVLLMILLYPVLQMKGLALAFVISTYIQVAYYLWHTGKLIKENVSNFFPVRSLIMILAGSCILMAACSYSIHSANIYIRLFIGAAVCSILILTSLFTLRKKFKFFKN